jgi:hypothetical protein
MSLKDHAIAEFKNAGWIDENGKFCEDTQEAICNHILKLLEVFSEEGHSGSSAPYAIDLFTRLANYKPIGQLTGDDTEWNKLDYGCEPIYQNKRASNVFKNSDGYTYDVDGKVFWYWAGTKQDYHKVFYTSKDSHTSVTFPYTVPDKPIYEYRCSVFDYEQLPQTEEGLI